MGKKIRHKITNAYEAYWFLYEHPKLMAPTRNEVTPEEAARLEAEGYWITRDTGGKCYRMWRHMNRRAFVDNLSIFYTKVNHPDRGRVDDDPKKNKFVECWLEFGPLEYGYAYSGSGTPLADYDDTTMLHHYHDIDLDTGGPTFDIALVRLARLVRKKYGDYADNDKRESKCGKPVCADCRAIGRTMKKIGLEAKPS